MLKVHTKRWGASEVLCLEGHIVTGDTELLRNTFEAASRAGDVILDLANVSVVDAHGLGVLLQLRETSLAKGDRLHLMNVSGPLHRIFEITRLHTVFEINSKFLPQFAYAGCVLAAA